MSKSLLVIISHAVCVLFFCSIVVGGAFSFDLFIVDFFSVLTDTQLGDRNYNYRLLFFRSFFSSLSSCLFTSRV